MEKRGRRFGFPMKALAMADAPTRLITGIGIVSCLGEGPEAHLAGLNDAAARPTRRSFAPCIVHPSFRSTSTGRSQEGRSAQMEPWQRIGTYAAGLRSMTPD